MPAPRERVFAALTDPAVLARCIPGCEKLEKLAENQYAATLAAGAGPIKGVFAATITLENATPPSGYRLVVEGKGQPGFVKGQGDMQLEEMEGGGTRILYVGEVNVGGLLAGVGQRMIESTARMLAGKFFAALHIETTKP